MEVSKKIDLVDCKIDIIGKIALLYLNRDDLRNALTGTNIIQDIEKAINFINNNNNISVLLITGNGKAFSAGGNIKEMYSKNSSFSGAPHEVEKKYRYGIQTITKNMERLEVPSIAAINGPAIGAGLDLACMCDIRIMSDKAYLAESFINLGIIPGDGGAFLLQRIVGYQKAAELSFTGRKIYAEEALKIGLVLDVYDEKCFLDKAKDLAKNISNKPPQALRYTKRLLKLANKMSLEELLDFSALFQGISHNTNEHKQQLKVLKKKN